MSYFYNELRKLKGTLVVVLGLVAPLLVAFLLLVIIMRQPVMTWRDALSGACGLWAYFVMPMSVTALSALIAQIEHGPRAWDHILALPVARWKIFAAKSAVVLLIVALMSAVLLGELRVAGWLVEMVRPDKVPTGAFAWTTTARMLAGIWAASLLMTGLQLWVALRFRSFVAPLTLGISGTFFSVAAFGAKEAIYLPWVMPVSVVANWVEHPNRVLLALEMGAGGGLVILALMTLHLSRKEA